MPYLKLYYHFVWATAQRQPFISPQIETAFYRYVARQVEELKGVLYALNGMPDHVHLIVSLPPTVRISDFIRRVKGSSSHYVGTEFNQPFAWQEGYSAFTISERNLPQAIEYVEHQKEHHANGKTYASLEPSEDLPGLRAGIEH